MNSLNCSGFFLVFEMHLKKATFSVWFLNCCWIQNFWQNLVHTDSGKPERSQGKLSGGIIINTNLNETHEQQKIMSYTFAILVISWCRILQFSPTFLSDSISTVLNEFCENITAFGRFQISLRNFCFSVSIYSEVKLVCISLHCSFALVYIVLPKILLNFIDNLSDKVLL